MLYKTNRIDRIAQNERAIYTLKNLNLWSSEPTAPAPCPLYVGVLYPCPKEYIIIRVNLP